MDTLQSPSVADTEQVATVESITVVEKSPREMQQHCGPTTALKVAQTMADCSDTVKVSVAKVTVAEAAVVDSVMVAAVVAAIKDASATRLDAVVAVAVSVAVSVADVVMVECSVADATDMAVKVADVTGTAVAVADARDITASQKALHVTHAAVVAQPPFNFLAVVTHVVAAAQEVTSANRSDTIMEPPACTALFKVVRVVPAVEPMLAATNQLQHTLRQSLAKQSKEQQQWLSRVKSLPTKDQELPEVDSAKRSTESLLCKFAQEAYFLLIEMLCDSSRRIGWCVKLNAAIALHILQKRLRDL